MSQCVYFTGISSKTCKLGHTYSMFKQKNQSFIQNLPCLQENIAARCQDRRTEPLPEPEKQQTPNGFLLAMAVKARLKDTNTPKNLQIRGSIDCPVCKTSKGLLWEQHNNGHIKASCATCNIAISQ